MQDSNDNIAATAVEKWGFALQDLYRLALNFYKQNSGKAVHLSYEDNLKLIAFKQQATMGPFNEKTAPALGVLDVIGRDRRMHWQLLGDISKEQAMEDFIDLLDNMCSAFRPYIEAVKQDREQTLQAELRKMEQEKLEREKREKEQQEILEEGYKEEMQRRQLQDALNKQTYQQFKNYAEKQFPGNPEQQAVLIHQLQQEHYHQYMQQLHLQHPQGIDNVDEGSVGEKQPEEGGEQEGSHTQTVLAEYGEEVVISPAKMWTRPDIVEFKAEVSAGDGDGVITIGHGDSVTVRVPTNANGKCIFFEFATDNYDIGFGIYFEWSKPVTHEVTVHVCESEEEDEDGDADYFNYEDDVECGSNSESRIAPINDDIKPPISIISPIYRRECFNEVYVGSHTYPGEGVYLLKFDNSYSIWRSKTLYYRVYYER